jgi:hypothetical protein
MRRHLLTRFYALLRVRQPLSQHYLERRAYLIELQTHADAGSGMRDGRVTLEEFSACPNFDKYRGAFGVRVRHCQVSSVNAQVRETSVARASRVSNFSGSDEGIPCVQRRFSMGISDQERGERCQRQRYHILRWSVIPLMAVFRFDIEHKYEHTGPAVAMYISNACPRKTSSNGGVYGCDLTPLFGAFGEVRREVRNHMRWWVRLL